MSDFFQIQERSLKKEEVEVFPDFKVGRSKDLMIRGKSFYAVWDEEKNIWSTDAYTIQNMVDKELLAYKKDLATRTEARISVKYLRNFSSGSWTAFDNYIKRLPDAFISLDEKLMFANMEMKKSDYASKRLPYPLEKTPIDAYDELIGTLYDPEERQKLEWAIGAIVSGDSKTIQKFIVLYGEAGAGKSTILNIIQKLFEGYYTTFEASALASANDQFSTEVFKSNPLVAIQHDGDLSKIEDNTRLNSIISHEEMTVNEKHKPKYTTKYNCFLFMATNRPVKITDAKSGIIRRLIDVKPSGRKVPTKKYHALTHQVEFELGGIASHCLEVYNELGKDFYSTYVPFDMMFQTDIFFNYVADNYDVFMEEDGITLKRAYSMYKDYCDETLAQFKLPLYKFREELKNYFRNYDERIRIGESQVRSYYSGFIKSKIFPDEKKKEEATLIVAFEMNDTESLFDKTHGDCLAQYAAADGGPEIAWVNVKTTLKDLDTRREHYVQVPVQEIVIDFDLKDETGAKSRSKNIEAASKWPPTYSEFSKSSCGIHLHYIYDGDTNLLKRLYDKDIEVKVQVGNAALRRKLSKCNTIPIATISSGLPLREEKMLNFEGVKSEKALRELIKKNLNKEYHSSTRCSMDFIKKILDDAYDQGLKYDVTDIRPKILVFAMGSTNQSDYCLRLIEKIKFKSEDISIPLANKKEDPIVFFDVEVFPNLFICNWKYQGPDRHCVRMINPTPAEIEDLLKMKLVGFNCRRYDNHILYARYIGYTNFQLFQLSQKIINESRNALFGEAYNISYTDVLDFSSEKQSLKKFEIELGIHHKELGLPWDKPVPEHLWTKVAEYCDNDVIATEAVFEARKSDWVARQILAEMSGLSVNDTTQMHTAKIIFGDDKRPQDKFIYTDLREQFPGYVFNCGKSMYRGEETGEGGYVYAETGMYSDVALLDVESMHPNSLINMNMFGPYTSRYKEILDARLAIKHKDYEKAALMLAGMLSKYLSSKEDSKSLSYALKIVINIVYGLTSAKFENKFKDPRNIDNIVAKRGALFMIDLKHAVQEKGYKVAHIKTDSIKIPNATPEIIKFVTEFAKKYGYNFKHEATYSRICLVNDAVYIARYASKKKCSELYGYVPEENDEHENAWTATGSQFAQPYVFKTLFSKENVVFKDLCETKTVNSALYLDMNEGYEDVSVYEKVKHIRESLVKDPESKLTGSEIKALNAFKQMSDEELEAEIAKGHNYHFVGKAGSYCPIKPDCGGGLLLREKDGKFYAAGGTKGYRWLEAEVVTDLRKESDVDVRYYDEMVDDAIRDISKHGSFDWFVSDIWPVDSQETPPWSMPCGEMKYATCVDCPHFKGCRLMECDLGFDLTAVREVILDADMSKTKIA